MAEKKTTLESVQKILQNAHKQQKSNVGFERAFGQLMIAWADAEMEMYRVLIKYAGVTDAVGRALFSGTRMKAMMDYIKSIDHNAPLPLDRSTDLAHVFPQISLINSIRDHIVHHSSSSYSFNEPTRRVIANRRASRYGNTLGYEFSEDDIRSMTYDLHGIANHLNMHHGPRSGPFTPWREDSPDGQPTAWTYKQPQQVPKWETSPEGAQTSPLQRKSSST